MSQATVIHERIKSILGGSQHWTEARYHKKASHVMGVLRGEVSEMSSKHYEGIGIRCLINGTWGFASTGDTTDAGIKNAVQKAVGMARELASRKKNKIQIAPLKALAKGNFFLPGYEELEKMSWEEKFKLVKETEEKLRKSSKQVESASCVYSEVFEEKIIVTTDGADSHMKLVRPEFRLSAFAADGSRRTRGHESTGATGAWDCLFRNNTVDVLIDETGRNAVSRHEPGVADRHLHDPAVLPAVVGHRGRDAAELQGRETAGVERRGVPEGNHRRHRQR